MWQASIGSRLCGPIQEGFCDTKQVCSLESEQSESIIFSTNMAGDKFLALKLF